MNRTNNLNLNKKISLITGSAGYIGKAIVEKLCLHGSHVILVDINKKKLTKQKSNLEKKYTSGIDIIAMDLTSISEQKKILKFIKEKYNSLDILINSIGMVGTDSMAGWNEEFDQQSLPAWTKGFDTNLTSVFFLIQSLHKLMTKTKNGSIVNIASMYGVHAPDWDLYKGTNIKNPAAYSISKAGLIHMTKWLASTLAPYIRVNAVSPGGVFRNQQSSFIKKYSNNTLLKRMASEEEIADPVLFLASDMSSYITGQNIVIDGGWTIK